MRLHHLFHLVVCTTAGPSVAAQMPLDTVVLSKAECGMRYKVYLWHLFFGGGPSSYGYRPRTEQDHLFLDSMPDRYHLVFNDTKGRKLFEGEVHGGSASGPVIFYRRNASVLRKEHWGSESDLQAMPEVEWSDVEHEIGTWSYYDRRGRLRKEVFYATLSIPRTHGIVHRRLRITASHGRHGPKKHEKVEVLDSTE